MPRGARPGERRGGRRKGTPNKVTTSVKEALTLAFAGAGGLPALVRWAEKHPGDFYRLWAKLLPREVTGEGGGPIRVEHSVTDRIDQLAAAFAGAADRAGPGPVPGDGPGKPARP